MGFAAQFTPAAGAPVGQKTFVVGFDVGGQSIGAEMYEVTDGRIGTEPVWKLKGDADKGETTKRGKQAHINQMTSIMQRAVNAATAQGGRVVAFGVGSPGRFDPETGNIKRGTNTNVGNSLPDGGNDMDGVNLKTEYTDALTNELGDNTPQIFVNNDGSAMLAGMIDAIAQGTAGDLSDQNGDEFNKGALRNKTIAVFGIGTGIGHAIATTDENGKFSGFKTDGHASKLWIDVDSEDLTTLNSAVEAINKKIAEQNEVLLAEDKPTMALVRVVKEEKGGAYTRRVRAEDLFSAPVINALAGLTKQDVANGQGRNPDTENMQKALSFAGKYMARTIKAVAAGKNDDVEPANGWSAADKAAAAATQVYLIGGDIGRKPVGKALIDAAKTHLENDEVTKNIKLVQYTGTPVAARAAATMIPPEHLKNNQQIAK